MLGALGGGAMRPATQGGRPSIGGGARGSASRAVELAVAFAVIGSALAAAAPACVRAVRLSRTAEAVESLEKISVSGAAYLAAHPAAQTSASMRLTSTPLTPPQVPLGHPVHDADGAFAHPTFKALGFEPPQPHWYSYRVDIDPDPATPMRVVAYGDLDGDGVLSTFTRTLGRDGNSVVVRPGLVVVQDLE